MLASPTIAPRRSSDPGARFPLRPIRAVPLAPERIYERFEAARAAHLQTVAAPPVSFIRPALQRDAARSTQSVFLQWACRGVIAAALAIGIVAGAVALGSIGVVMAMFVDYHAFGRGAAAAGMHWRQIFFLVIAVMYARVAAVTSLLAAYCAFEALTFRTLLQALQTSQRPGAAQDDYAQARDSIWYAARNRAVCWAGVVILTSGMCAKPMLLVHPCLIAPPLAFGALVWASRR